ncbi:FeoA family protein [Halapricum desulfuricans]|uniref:Fe2+ transport system protein A n=1 Tax=Halapricum desulfuricans TaxID=2841257 RepID=A0A897N201_9EURY|nr:FeoA family protein [Halapricum desulfuricans]QSG04735.1 Fe2+ transport system protein A [Halapricum desulfuricans]
MTGQSDAGGGRSNRQGKRRRKRRRKRRCKRCRLDDLECGECARIEDVDRECLRSMGVRPGKTVEVHTKHPFGGPVVVSVGRSTVSLSRSQARDLEVATEE